MLGRLIRIRLAQKSTSLGFTFKIYWATQKTSVECKIHWSYIKSKTFQLRISFLIVITLRVATLELFLSNGCESLFGIRGYALLIPPGSGLPLMGAMARRYVMLIDDSRLMLFES